MLEKLNLVDGTEMKVDLVKRAWPLALSAHSTPDRSYLSEKSSSHAIFAFPGSGTLKDWLSPKSFGNTPVDLKLFPSLKSIGNDEIAVVNSKFFQQFKDLLNKDSGLIDEVDRAVNENKKVVFTGYSSGGPIAIFATIWFLQQNRVPAASCSCSCVTFGSPLVGNQIFGHAVRREDWAQYFVHVVMRYDIIPRVLLSPLSSFKKELQTLLPCFNPGDLESIASSKDAASSFRDVMRNASSVASNAACSFMGCINSLLETVTNFMELSPYRPFGTYWFFTGKGRVFTVENPDAILQLLFYSLQSENREAVTAVAYRSFKDHLEYGTEITDNLGKEDVVNLEHLLLQLPLSSAATGRTEIAIKELGLSTRAMLCLTAAKELEKHKQSNLDKINNNRKKIDAGLLKLQDYRARGEMREVGYYDSFKLQKESEDFQANVTRLDLAGIWDEIIEMLKTYDLPDSFELNKDWVELGTKLRRLMEPLDIANFYRHSKDADSGAYMGPRGRPKRYRFTQRWLEYAQKKPVDYFSESCFLAEVEDLKIQAQKKDQDPSSDVVKLKNRVVKLEENLLRWAYEDKLLRKDEFFEKSTFVKWWKTLSSEHRDDPKRSQIAALVEEKGRELPSYADEIYGKH